MAILQQPSTSSGDFHLFDIARSPLPPAGTFPAVVLEVRDRLGVERKKYQSEEVEVVDLSAFLFGFRAADGTAWRIDTKPFRISGHPKSGLFKFLAGLLGKPPAYGLDTATLKGTKCLLSVAHATSASGTEYAFVSSAIPLPSPAPAAPVPAPADVPDEDSGWADSIPF